MSSVQRPHMSYTHAWCQSRHIQHKDVNPPVSSLQHSMKQPACVLHCNLVVLTFNTVTMDTRAELGMEADPMAARVEVMAITMI